VADVSADIPPADVRTSAEFSARLNEEFADRAAAVLTAAGRASRANESVIAVAMA
jgi:hypothetical protein